LENVLHQEYSLHTQQTRSVSHSKYWQGLPFLYWSAHPAYVLKNRSDPRIGFG
jgi:hypothetical protein